MPESNDPRVNCEDSERADRFWHRVRVVLEKRRTQVFEQIMNYPSPVPACDEQFNNLLEIRARVSSELTQLTEISHTRKSLRDR